MKGIATVLVSTLAIGCSNGVPGGPVVPTLPGAGLGRSAALDVKGHIVKKPVTSGNWNLTLTATSVSVGCGGEPLPGESFTEQVVVIQNHHSLEWRIAFESDRYFGKIRGNDSFEVSGSAEFGTAGEMFVGKVDATAMNMGGEFTFTDGACSVVADFAMSRSD